MALGINFDGGGSSGGGKFLPVVKFDAKVGDFIAVNREPQGDGSWDKVEVEIDLPIKAVADFANLSVGWITFAPTYSATLAPAGEKMPAKPSADHKQAVSLKLFFKEHGLREFTPTSKTVMRVIDQLHDQFIAEAGDNKGKMPVIEFSGTETVKVSTPQGELRFKAPTCKLVGWVAPPEAFAEHEAKASAAAPAPAPAPAAKPAPKKAPRADEEDEF
jgi:hypothetical protein